MRARIAGLVSPTGTEPEEDALTMVEIPLTSPPTAIASCNLTGHVACLSAESVVNLFLFRTKDVSGRVKAQYHDFDRTYAIEMPGFAPTKLHFLHNYLVCMNSQKVHVIRVIKGRDELLQENSSVDFACYHQPVLDNKWEKVVFDPHDEDIKVYLPSITRANRRRKHSNSGLTEEFHNDISSNHAKVIYSAVIPSITVEDALRIGISNCNSSSQSKLVEVGLYPIRVKGK